MRLSLLAAAAVGFAIYSGGASAQPDGPPWNSFGGPASDTCASCHFDRPPVDPSPALSLEGLNEAVRLGGTYQLTIRLATPELLSAGFLLAARWDGGRPAGRFVAGERAVETSGAAVRSIRTEVSVPGAAEWSFVWYAPDDGGGEVSFFLAANAANDDASPLGDEIHLRQVRVPLQ